MMALKGLARYMRFIAKRERIISPIWIVAMVGLTAGLVAMYPGIFPTEEAMLSMAQALNTPSMVALMGPVYGMDELSMAIVMAQECLLWSMIPMMIMNIFFINRHTRHDEELGRLEMLRALPVGRLTSSVAALIGAVILNLGISMLMAGVILVVDIPGTSVAGAFAYSLANGAVGFVFAAFTLLFAQLFSTSRGTLGWSFGAAGIFYMLRASGDMSGNVLSYIAPMGLGQQVLAFYENRFWTLAVVLCEALVISAVSLVVCAKRDLGEGVIPARPGRKTASRFLRSPLGLSWRLTRSMAFGWWIAAFSIGAVYGSVAGKLEEFISQNDMIKQMMEAAGGGNSLLDQFIAMIFSVMAIIGAIPIITLCLRIHGEEKRGRLEQVFSKSVSRLKFLLCFIGIALFSGLVFMLLTVTGFYASAGGESPPFGDLLGAALSYLPAMWALMGLAVLLIGLLPKLTALVWAMFAYIFLMIWFGRILDLPEWCLRISPYGNIAQMPVQEFELAPLIVLTLVAVALTATGIVGFRRRDIG